MIIVDDFIKDKTLLDNIANDRTFFDNNGEYYWYDGWWVEEPNTLKKRLIEYIWGHQSPYHEISVCGFEYWTGQFGPQKQNQELPAHLDKDEAEFEKTGKHIAPVMGTVFYPLPMDIEGGDLIIHSEDNKPPEIVKPVFNRLIIFPAGEYLHKVNPVTKGLRSAIAINLWAKKPSGEFLKEPIQVM